MPPPRSRASGQRAEARVTGSHAPRPNLSVGQLVRRAFPRVSNQRIDLDRHRSRLAEKARCVWKIWGGLEKKTIRNPVEIAIVGWLSLFEKLGVFQVSYTFELYMNISIWGGNLGRIGKERFEIQWRL